MSRYVKTHRSKDLKRSVLVISHYLIQEMKVHQEYKLNNMYLYLKNKLKIQQKDFVYALNFLYILGKLEYIRAEDTIRLSK